MGQSLDVLSTCDGAFGQDQRRSGNGGRPGTSCWDEDASVGCAALEDGVKHVVATANRGGARISDEVLLNHELLQFARQGNIKGVSAALERGAWTETRRPLVMKPQKPDVSKGGGHEKGDLQDIGMTPLMFSAQNGSVECVRRLLWAGAEVNAVEEDGWSALHFAAKDGHLEVCTTLLQSRAEYTLTNSDDKTPLQIAEEEDEVFAEKLRAALANRGKQKKTNGTPNERGAEKAGAKSGDSAAKAEERREIEKAPPASDRSGGRPSDRTGERSRLIDRSAAGQGDPSAPL